MNGGTAPCIFRRGPLGFIACQNASPVGRLRFGDVQVKGARFHPRARPCP